jgi:hypothetical protein
MNEKEIIFQMLGREIDNIVAQFGPMASMFSGSIKKFIFEFLDPYLDAFMNPKTEKINTEAVKEFTKQEVSSKVNDFMKKFETQVGGGNDLIV